jgi:hypothetical protein
VLVSVEFFGKYLGIRFYILQKKAEEEKHMKKGKRKRKKRLKKKRKNDERERGRAFGSNHRAYALDLQKRHDRPSVLQNFSSSLSKSCKFFDFARTSVAVSSSGAEMK